MVEYNENGFARGYAGTFDYGEAIAQLKAGEKVLRDGWNGKDMWLQLVPKKTAELALTELPYIQMKTADGYLVPWLASQSDMLAEDWRCVVDPRS